MKNTMDRNKINAQCQNCFQRGHWTYECKNSSVYLIRPSYTQILKNSKLKPRFQSKESIPDIPRITDGDFKRDETLRKKREREYSLALKAKLLKDKSPTPNSNSLKSSLSSSSYENSISESGSSSSSRSYSTTSSSSSNSSDNSHFSNKDLVKTDELKYHPHKKIHK